MNTITDKVTGTVHDMALLSPACGNGRGVDLRIGTDAVTCTTCLARRVRVQKQASLYATLPTETLEARRRAEANVRTVMTSKGYGDGHRVRLASERITLIDVELKSR